MIFSMFRFSLHPQIPDFQILSNHNKPYINGKIIYSGCRLCINLNFEKLTLMTGFVVQGHNCPLNGHAPVCVNLLVSEAVSSPSSLL